jgi:hypothetical protein
MANVHPGDPNAPILLRVHYECTDERACSLAVHALTRAAAQQVEADRANVRTYAFAPRGATSFDFLEIYANEAVFWSHGDGVEDAIQALFQPDIRLAASGAAVGQKSLSEGVVVVAKSMQLATEPLLAGFLDRDSKKPITNTDDPVVLIVSMPAAAAPAERRDRVVQLFGAFERQLISFAAIRTAALYVMADGSLEIALVSTSASILVAALRANKSSFLRPLAAIVPDFSIRMLGANTPVDFDDVVDMHAASTFATLAAGYAVHPLVQRAVHTGLAEKKAARDAAAAANASTSAPPTPPPLPASTAVAAESVVEAAVAARVDDNEDKSKPPVSSPLFDVQINPYSHVAESVVFKKDAPGRSPHLVKKDASGGASAEKSNVLEVPLLLVIRKLCARGALDVDVPLDLLFGQLERLRSLRRERDHVNAQLSSGNRESDERIERFLELISTFGYTLRADDRAVAIAGLDELVAVIEWAWRDVIGAARESIGKGQVSYRGLMELFQIGSVVRGASSSLGGADVAYRVLDVYYSTMRSMFGGKKFVFTIACEFVVNVGQFVMASFEEKLEEFDGERELVTLPFQLLKQYDEFVARGNALAQMGIESAFRAYRAGSFFAHRRDTDRSSMFSQVGAGRCVVDNVRGIMLGHSPGAGFDGPGTAINATLKAYRVLLRSQMDGESAVARAERARVAQLRIFDRLPPELACIAWPAVVAFSITAKVWGHVIVHGLSPVAFALDAWDKVILPAKTKELLLATAQFFVSGAQNRLADITPGKATGTLVLLHGPPGTGKTVCVEALAELHRRPLYVLSFGELGTDTTTLESTMNNVLALCAEWGSFVLLDEGDALLERRERGQLLLNSLVGVLLRSLDVFNGVLFVSSNRLAHVDPAALSRVTLAIHFRALDEQARAKVWHNVLVRAKADLALFDCPMLGAKFELSGREVNAAVRLALALAMSRGVELNQQVLLDALAVSIEFRSEFPAETW